MARMVIQYDTEVGAFYIRLTDTDVARTFHVSDDVLVDFDSNDDARGIELLVHPAHLTDEERGILAAAYAKAPDILAEVARLMPAAA